MSTCTCEQIVGGGRRVDPACPEHRPLEDRIEEVLRPLVAEVRAGAFRPEYAAEQSDAKVLGVIVSKFLKWDGDAILETAEEALEDANFSGEAEQVKAMREVV